ncbi:MAG: hypothetical protein ACI9ZX_001942 [Algoriphagus sp.]|jgi:uncharacterized protein YbaP (TraB family)
MRFNELGLAIAFCFVLLSTANSQTSTDQSLLWEISGKGLKENSYLFGTIHMICPSDFLMDDRIKNAFEDANELIMELDMDDPEMLQKMQQSSLNPEKKNIKSAFSEADANALNKFLTANYGAGLDQLGILKPFMLMSMITVKQLPCEQIESYELFFTNLATTQNKNVEGLESVEFQMGLFDEIPEEILLKEISKMVTSDDSIKEFEQLVNAYIAEDIDQLYQVIAENEMMDNFNELMLDNRNRNWIPLMEKNMKENQVFFAVGSGHLGGENGVINLLRNQGYEVKPIR